MANDDGGRHSELVETLHEVAGDAVRSVCTYDEENYDLLFMRENVDAIYSTEEIEEIFDDLRLEGWGRERLEGLFNAGGLECSIYGFEDAMMFHFVENGFEGAFVTYDRGADVDVEAFLEACESAF